MLSLENISKSFNKVEVLKDVSLEVLSQESLGIMGKSGSGKTTLIRILLRLIDPDQGRIIYKNQDLTRTSNKDLKEFRKKVQLISQRPESSFDPSMKIRASLIEPMKNFSIYDKNTFDSLLDEKLKELKLSKSLLDRYPHQLSGGEVQRFAIIRALLLKPEILVLDECTSMLDISVQAQILYILKEIRRVEKLAYIVISHDPDLIKFITDRTLELKNGRLKTLDRSI